MLNQNIETIEKVGFKKYKSSSKSIRGLILGLIQKFSNDARNGITYSPYTLLKVFEEVLNKFSDLEDVAISRINFWKGKSGIIQLIKTPDRIIAIRMQKPDKENEPKEVRIEMTKEEINAVIFALNELSENQPIKTKDIAMIYSKLLNLNHENWKMFFADRTQHNKLTNILDVLDKEGIIKYCGGLTTILGSKIKIQMILK